MLACRFRVVTDVGTRLPNRPSSGQKARPKDHSQKVTISEILSMHGPNSDIYLVVAKDKGRNDCAPVLAWIITSDSAMFRRLFYLLLESESARIEFS